MKTRFLFILITVWTVGILCGWVEKKDEEGVLNKPLQSMGQDKSKDDYSLRELLGNVPEVYVAPIQEALGVLLTPPKLESLRFRPVTGGLSTARLYRTEIDRKPCVMRLLDPKRQIEKRLSEIEGIALAAGLNIGPKLLYASTSTLVVFVEYIEGRTFSHEDLADGRLVRTLMRSIRTFHDAAAVTNLFRAQVKKIDTIQARYERHVNEGAVYPSCYGGLFQELRRDFASVAHANPCAIHGDLKPENIIIANDGRIYLIDCAEACVESPLYDIGWFACFSGASSDQVYNLLREYYGRKPSQAELNEAFLFRDFTSFFLATAWIGRQGERNQERLDALLQTPLAMGSAYIKRGITTRQMMERQGAEVTEYALGWLKEFMESRFCLP